MVRTQIQITEEQAKAVKRIALARHVSVAELIRRRDIVDSLNAAIGRTLAMPDIRDRLLNAGSEPTPSTPDALARKYADWVERFGKIAKQAGIKPQ